MSNNNVETISPKRAAFILGHMYGLNGALGAPVLFIGPPGGGKTTLVREYTERYCDGNMAVIEVSRMQGTDIAIPIPDHVNKRVDFYTNGELQDLANCNRGTVFFDELTRPSDQGALAAVLNVFLERKIGKTNLKHVLCWAAANPADQVGGVELDPAFMNRLVLVQWPDNNDAESYADHMNRVDSVTGHTGNEDWPEPCDWKAAWPAAWEAANRKVIGFIRTQPNMLTEDVPATPRAWRSKRSWALATNVLAACEIHGATVTEKRALLAGTIGDEAAFAFLTWVSKVDLPNPWDVIADKVDLSKRRADEVFVILSAAVDTYIQACKADKNDKRLDHKVFYGMLDTQSARHMEIITALAGRIAKSGQVNAHAVKLFQKAIGTVSGAV